MSVKKGRKELSQQASKGTSPSYKPPQVDTSGYDFFLHVPEDRTKVISITLHLSFCRETIPLKPIPAHECLWTAHLEIPTSVHKKSIYYYYRIIVRGSFLYVFAKNSSYDTVRKPLCGTVHRDESFSKYLTSKGYLAHCLHIFDICDRTDVFRCIEQVEAISFLQKSTFEEKHKLVENLQSRVTVFKRNSLILFTLMLNKFFNQTVSPADSNLVTKDLIPIILETFKQEDPRKYSKSCQKGLQNILSAFCRFAYGTEYCLFDFIYETYPFFDERFYRQKIVVCVNDRKTLCSANKKAEAVKEILIDVGKRLDADPEAELDIVFFLDKLFNYIPFSLALHGYCYFCNSLSFDEDKCTKMKERLLGALKANSEANISEHVTMGDLPRLLEFWEYVKAEQKLAEILSGKLQNNLLQLCETPKGKMLSENYCESLQKLVLDTHLFNDEQSQKQLLKATVSSKTKNLHELFINVVKHEKFSNSLSNNPSHLLKWMETAMKYHIFIPVKQSYPRKEVDVCSCYTYLHDALAMPVVYNNCPLQENLEKYVFENMAKLDPETVLGKYQDLEKMQEHKPNIMELFQRHVRQLLHKRYASYQPDDILRAVCKTSDQLFMNSSYSTMLVHLLMEQYCNCFGNNQFENFIYMEKMGKFWKLLLMMTGTQTDSAKNHEIFKKGIECLEFILESLKSKQITCSHLEKVSKSTDLLIATGKVKREEIDMLLENATKAVQKQKDKLNNTFRVLHKIKEVVPCNCLPVGWKNFEDHIKDKKEMLKDGKIRIAYVIDDTQFWSSYLKLPDICDRCVAYIDSKVFWNACLHTLPDKSACKEPGGQFLEENYETETLYLKSDVDIEKEELEEDSGTLESLRNLFSEYDNGLDSYACCVQFLENFEQLGSQKYRADWIMFCKIEDVPMTHVVKMFENADIQTEMSFQDRNLKLSIESKRKNALFDYNEFDKYHEKVKVMKMTLDALEIPLESDKQFYEAVTSFDKFMAHSLKEITLEQVYEAINTIKRIAQILDDTVVQVFDTIGTSTELIKFLKEVADVDLRNLIDAVEEVSEQSVNEATVLGLIEVKRLLQPFLKINMDHKFEDLFQTISDQTKGTKPIELVGKIIDYRENLHNLRSLYSNVANIGLKTKEIIDSVIKIGNFRFKVDTRETCIMSVEYPLDEKNISHEEDTLVDLRSRALLLMSTDTKSQTDETIKKKENLQKFLIYVDTALEIHQLLTNLYMSGHFQYKLFETKMEASGLQGFKDKLRDDYSSWCTRLEECQKEHYWMNFILGNQLHIIHDFLKTGKEKERVLSILQFIHPEIKIDGMREHYSNMTADSSELSLLDNIALTLKHAMKDLQPVSRFIDKSFTVSSRVTDCVRQGKLSLVALEENSKLVIQTMLALYKNTVRKLPEPHQVHFCNQDTTWVELQLLIHRCVRSEKGNLFCITNVEMLSNEVQFQLVEALQNVSVCCTFLLVIICCGTENHPFVNKFYDSAMPVHPLSDTEYRNILQRTWPDVCSVTSEFPGMGKTESIRQKSHKLDKGVVTFHISGPFNRSRLVERLASLRVKSHNVLHIDIGNVDNPMELDVFLFQIIVLSYASAGTSCVHMPTKHIFLEIANTLNNGLKNALQTAVSFSRDRLSWQDYADFIVGIDVNSPVQVVCHYLNALEDGTVDIKDIYFTGKKAASPLPVPTCQQLLKKYFPGTVDMSFNIARIFVNVLADQLKKMSCSAFFRTHNLQAVLGDKEVINVKSNLLKALINTSSEFASRSVNTCRKIQAAAFKSHSVIPSKSAGSLEDHNDSSLLKRTEGMIRWEDSNHLIFVFHNQDIQTLSAMYRDKVKVPNHIRNLFESQVKKALPDFRSKTASELQDILQRVARTNPVPLSKEKLENMAKDYALTPDNLLKMVLIMMRIKAHVPVIIMGETGCGKTSLIQYLSQICAASFKVIQIHAGVEEEHIYERVQKISIKAEQRLPDPVWLFLDEINTCNHLGLICDILCHHRCLGETLPPNLVVMAACNPYKLKPKEKILTAGLQGKIKADEMSLLIYRVFPLPETMVDYVWDFGSISDEDEKAYVRRMIQNVFQSNPKMDELFADLLIMSQRVVREIEESESCVSLRDVNRCKLLAKWFQNFLKKKADLGLYEYRHLEIRCMSLALAHCYHSRFANASDRRRYRNEIASIIQHHISWYDEDKVQEIITEEQKDILNRMDLPAGTAQNIPLQENVFIILVCILNRIPIFLVGKPGCSKSLSIQVIRSNLRGKDSKDPLFKLLPQLNCVSFQGSESSTSDGIIKVFEKAQRYQENNNPEEVLSVVILDEIGLAEISKFNPLKVLHSLLEPEGKFLNQLPNVAVVGISNWALDAAKMNRAIHLSRPEMDEEDLYRTGKSISKSMERKPAESTHKLMRQSHITLNTVDLEKELRSLANLYIKYVKEQTFANFHGLRDYYSLVKYIARTLSEIQNKEIRDGKKIDVITRGLQRNFGGQHSEKSALHELLKTNLQSYQDYRVPIIDLITENIQDKMARHLMLITCGDAILDILEQKLDKLGRDRITIYGSQFEEDLTDDYNYRILNRIIICMEQGLVLILKDLDSIYGSLYDMLNQNYTVVGLKKNCRVALGPYSNPMCQVHNDFRCIVLVEESKIDHADPPFLNRFEKQNLKFSDVLSNTEHVIISNLKSWVEQLRNVPTYDFDAVDVFPIYGPDMIPSLVHKCFMEMEGNGNPDNGSGEFFDAVTNMCKHRLLWIMKPEAVIRFGSSEFEKDKNNAKELQSITRDYLHLEVHQGIQKYFESEINGIFEGNEPSRMLMIFTNSNIHTNVQAILPDFRCQIDKLGAFKSEKQLTQRVQQFWSDPNVKLLVLQCKPLNDEAHILLARNIIERTRKEYLNVPRAFAKHVCIIMHLDRLKHRSVPQINFLTEWRLVMLDSLEEPRMPLFKSVSQSLVETIEQRRPLYTYIKEQLFWAFTRIKYAPGGRDIHSIDTIIKQIQSSENFLEILDNAIFTWIEERQEHFDVKNWQVEVACDNHALYSSSTFCDALENYIAQIINDPLARILFELEKVDALSAFFNADSPKDVQSIWKELFTNPKVFSVENTQKADKAECYTCSTPILQFKVPFFRVLYGKMEMTKSSFLETFQTVKLAAGIEDISDMPDITWKELLIHHEALITQEFPEVVKITYDNWYKDYQNDFCNITLCHVVKRRLTIDQRVQALNWCLFGGIEQSDIDATAGITSLHAAYWIHFGLFQSELQLLDMCQEILDEEKGGIVNLLQSTLIDSGATEYFPPCTAENQEDKHYKRGYKLLTGSEAVSKQQIDQAFENIPTMESQIISVVYDTVEEPNNDDELSSEEVDSNSSEEMITRHDLLVEQICNIFLPSDSTLSKYSDISVWHQSVCRVLALASQISKYAEDFHALRFCCDVTVQMILPLSVKTDSLKQLGSLLQNGLSLDNEEIRNLVQEMIKSVTSTHKCNAQKLVAAYCSRCIGANSDTEIMSWLMHCILDGSLPDNMLTNMKESIQHALYTDLYPDGKILFNLLDSKDGSPEVMQNSPFLLTMDICLKEMFMDGNVDSPFPALLTDILEQYIMNKIIKDDIATINSVKDQQVQHFIGAGKILLSDAFSLREVTAIAYIRSFITVLSVDLEKSKYETLKCKVVLQAVNAVLPPESKRMKSSKVFFLKCLRNKKWIYQLQRICKKLHVHLTCLEDNEWKKEFELLFVEMSPISHHVSKSISAFTTIFDAAKDVNAIKSLVERALVSKEEMLCLNSAVMTHFYMKRLISPLNETEKEKCGMIVNCAKELNMETKTLLILESFCGTIDFHVKLLQLNKESPSQYSNLASFVGHLLVMLIVYGCDAGKPLSIFTKSLLDPTCLSNLFLPGMPDVVTEKVAQIPVEFRMSKDKNLRVLTEGDVVDIHTSALHKLDLKVNYMPCKGYCLQNTSKFEEIGLGSRNISKLSSTVLHIILHGCLLGSFAVGFASEDNIHSIVGKEIETQVSVSLIQQKMETELSFLSSFLGLQLQDIVVFLHLVLYETTDLLCTDGRMMTLEADRTEWEKEFSKRIEILTADRFTKILDLRRNQNAMFGMPDDALENIILEVDEIKLEDKTQTLPSLWRSTVAPSLDNFISEVEGKKENFQFLQLLLNNLHQIKLLKHIGPVLHWLLTCFINVSYNMKKREAEKITIEDFLLKESDQKKRKLARNKLKEFINSWNDIIENRASLLKFDSEFPSLEDVNEQQQLKSCLYEGHDSPIFKVLSTLVCLQNKLIDETLKIAIKVKPLSLSFLRRHEEAMISCISLTDMTSRDIIDFKWDDSILRYSQNDVRYGCGRQIVYDFEKIEADIAREIFTNVKYLLMEDSLPKIIYTDELYQNYVGMIQHIQNSVEQKPLSPDLVEAIKKKMDNNSRQVSEFLTHLGIIMSLLKKTSGNHDTSFVDYVDKWKNIMTRPFPRSLLPSPEDSLRLHHLVSLHELLEELNADSIINSLDVHFRVKLNDYTEKKVSDLLFKKPRLAELTLKAVKRFVHRCLSSKTVDISQRMAYYLRDASFWPMGMVSNGILNHGDLVQDLQGLFPEDVTVKNVHPLFCLLDSKMKEQKQKEQSLNVILQSVSHHAKVSGARSSRRKAAAKFS